MKNVKVKSYEKNVPKGTSHYCKLCGSKAIVDLKQHQFHSFMPDTFYCPKHGELSDNQVSWGKVTKYERVK